MIRLVYASTLVPLTTGSDIDEIVAHSAVRNADRGITGMLAMEGDRICQILEGPDEAVLDLFARIAHDNRHQGVAEIERRSIERRAFADWTMVRRPMIDVVMMAFADGR